MRNLRAFGADECIMQISIELTRLGCLLTPRPFLLNFVQKGVEKFDNLSFDNCFPFRQSSFWIPSLTSDRLIRARLQPSLVEIERSSRTI